MRAWLYRPGVSADGGDLLRRARQARGLTQGQLAERAGTSQEQVSRWESGRRSPTVETLARLLAVLGFELTAREVPPPESSAARGTELQLRKPREGDGPPPWAP